MAAAVHSLKAATNATQNFLGVVRRGETIEEARELLLSGAGDRYGTGERVHAEVEQITE
jgi:hypothetical protein